MKKENRGFKRDARDWKMEAKRLRKLNDRLEFKVEYLEASCELIIYSHLLTCTCDHAGKSKGQPHSYKHERLKEQAGVVEVKSGMYWDMQREFSTLQTEKENAKQEV